MLKVRVIPTLLYKDFGLVKGVGFDSRRAVGAAMQAIKVYNLRGVDELVFFDVTATIQNRGPDLALIDELADDCFMPLTVGGGVHRLDDVRALLASGADKVALGAVAADDPDLVRAAADRFGSQCVSVVVDFRVGDDGAGQVWTRSGTVQTQFEAADYAAQMAERGAGEIILQSIDRDGTMTGYDLAVITSVADAVTIPVVASGGAGDYDDLVTAVQHGASGVAAASMFHFTERTPLEAKLHMKQAGLPVRLP